MGKRLRWWNRYNIDVELTFNLKWPPRLYGDWGWDWGFFFVLGVFALSFMWGYSKWEDEEYEDE